MKDSTLPGPPIPYPAAYDGPRRILRLNLRRGVISAGAVHVTIDGTMHVLAWGPASFEIPSDRPVSVGAYQVMRSTIGAANIVLPPEASAELEYRGPAHPSRPGEIGPVGTVRSRGLGCQLVLLTILVLLLLILVGFIVLVFTSI